MVRAEDAVKQRPAHLEGKDPVIVRRRPWDMPEVPDAGVARHAVEPFPQHPGHQAQVVVLDQDADLRPRPPSRPGFFRQGVGERLTIGQVGLPVRRERQAELRLVRGVEQQVVHEPQGRVGHVVVSAVEDVRRDVEHPHRHPAGSRVPVSGCRAAVRSASLSAAQIQVTSARGATAASPDVTPAIMPPPPRWPVSEPSMAN